MDLPKNPNKDQKGSKSPKVYVLCVEFPIFIIMFKRDIYALKRFKKKEKKKDKVKNQEKEVEI